MTNFEKFLQELTPARLVNILLLEEDDCEKCPAKKYCKDTNADDCRTVLTEYFSLNAEN